jgi:hypothetical protein
MLEDAKRWNGVDLQQQKGDEYYCFKWDCATQEATLRPGIVERRSKWTEAAYIGDWEMVFRLAFQDIHKCGPTDLVNTTRLQKAENITSSCVRPLSGFTALHQAAWHGAPVEVVQGLLDLGAYRTLTHPTVRRSPHSYYRMDADCRWKESPPR